MKTIKITLFIIFVFCALGFAQSKEDTTEVINMKEQYKTLTNQLQKDELQVMNDKSQLFDLQIKYNQKITEIAEKAKTHLKK